MLILLNKPYGMLSQFTPEPGSAWSSLAACDLPPNVYPIGRLDADSEGMLLLTDEAPLVKRVLDPERGHWRTYYVHVERIPDEEALQALRSGVTIGGYRTRPARVERLDPAPALPERQPPIRMRKSVPDCWISLSLTEGKNRQVRRMTAAVGHPTLRLVRVRIGGLPLASLPPGTWRECTEADRRLLLDTAGR